MVKRPDVYAPRFVAGDVVTVDYIDGPRQATVVEMLRWGGKPHKMPLYLVSIDGVEGKPGYRDDEMTPA